MKHILIFSLMFLTSCQKQQYFFPTMHENMTAEIYFQSGEKILVDDMPENCTFIDALKSGTGFIKSFTFTQDEKIYIINMQKVEHLILREKT